MYKRQPEELAEAAAIDRGEAPPAEPSPASIDPEQKRRDQEVLAKHRDAQRAALDAARLSDDAGSSGTGRYLLMLVVVVVLGIGAWFAYMTLMVGDGATGDGAPAGSSE